MSADGRWHKFIVLRRIGQGAASAAALSYPVTSILGLLDPQFSPDGESMVIKIGLSGDRYDSYFLFVWNRKTNRVQQVLLGELSYLLVRWSPDSRYVAFLRGGDIEGETRDDSPVELLTFNVRTGQSHSVAKGRQIKSFAWTNQGTLLYSMMPPAEPAPTAAPATGTSVRQSAKTSESIRPAIYEAAAEGGPTKLVIAQGYEPKASPDGRWIAFFGWPDDAEEPRKPVRPDKGISPPEMGAEAIPKLYLYKRQNGTRTLVPPASSGHGALNMSTADIMDTGQHAPRGTGR